MLNVDVCCESILEDVIDDLHIVLRKMKLSKGIRFRSSCCIVLCNITRPKCRRLLPIQYFFTNIDTRVLIMIAMALADFFRHDTKYRR
jgi:hypothetical protein